jgi:hypothetical protein
MNPTIIAECKEPWLFWWLLLTIDEKKAIKKKYFPDSHPHFTASLLDDEKQKAWEQEKPDPIVDLEWLQLVTTIYDYPRLPASRAEEQEIWRQVYRIASERI